jgi:hypothetical protein
MLSCSTRTDAFGLLQCINGSSNESAREEKQQKENIFGYPAFQLKSRSRSICQTKVLVKGVGLWLSSQKLHKRFHLILASPLFQ